MEAYGSYADLQQAFVDFANKVPFYGAIVACADDAELGLVSSGFTRRTITYGIDAPDAEVRASEVLLEGFGARCVVHRRHPHGNGPATVLGPLTLQVPGRHNLSNALAAIAGATAAGVPVAEAVAALGSFAGLARRFDIIGTSPSGITVIDDFGHNPEKIAATLATLKAHPGRVIAFFQPHGYGPLRQMGAELAEVLASRLGPDDLTILCDPVYFGGTVDRSVGSERIVALVNAHGGHAEHVPLREDCADRIVTRAQPGDRVVVMGARDDTLALFARNLLARLR